MKTCTLDIGDHSTEILIGKGLFDHLSVQKHPKTIMIVDELVYRHHKEKFKNAACILVSPGEQHKSLAHAETIYRELVKAEADRDTFIIGVGGGLVTDLSGFVASSFMRGVKFGFVSSTLLGQVDASIGGKNGVNLDGYKNMIGFIRQPEFVFCDLELLQTLDQKELVSGFSEVIKYGVIRDEALFAYLEEHYERVLEMEDEALEYAVTTSCGIKIDIVQSDVEERGNRKLLNFGHTMGHAIEKLTGMLHGYAVAIGMVLASRLSVNLGFMTNAEYERIYALIAHSELPVETDLASELIFETLLKDKKRSGDTMNLILADRVGHAFVHKMPLTDLKSAINDLY